MCDGVGHWRYEVDCYTRACVSDLFRYLMGLCEILRWKLLVDFRSMFIVAVRPVEVKNPALTRWRKGKLLH
jgi:hypothetical protein